MRPIYIYGEIVIIENLLINLVILKITSLISRKKVFKRNLFFAASLGAIYTVFQYQYIIFTHMLFKILLSIIIILISFIPKNIKEFTNQMLVFYAITLLFGGFVIGLIIMGNSGENLKITISGVSLTTLLMGIFVGVLAIIKIKEIIVDSKLKSNTLLDICIRLDDKVILTRGFTDTGCTITDGLTGRPILIVEFEQLKKILPEEIREYYSTYDNRLDADIDKKLKNINLLNRIRFVPYNTVNSPEKTYMFCFQFDEITLFDEKSRFSIEKIYIGISNRKFSQDSEFQALINPKLLYSNGGYGY